MKPITILAISFLLVIGLGISVVGASPLPSQVTSAGAYAMPYADSTPNPQKTKAPESETPDGNQAANARIAQAIAKYFSVTEAEVSALHDSGKGFGEIVKAYVLAQASGKSVDDILASRAQEQGWGEILKSLAVAKWNTSLGKVMRNAPPNKPYVIGNAPGGNEDHQNKGKHEGKDKKKGEDD